MHAHLVLQLPVSLGHMCRLTQERSLPNNSHSLTLSFSSFTSQWYVSTRSLATARWPSSAATVSGVPPAWGLGGTRSIQYTDNNLYKWTECKWTECWWWCAVGLHVCVYNSYSTLFIVVVCGKFGWYVCMCVIHVQRVWFYVWLCGCSVYWSACVAAPESWIIILYIKHNIVMNESHAVMYHFTTHCISQT